MVSDGADTASDRSLHAGERRDPAQRCVRLRDCDRRAGRRESTRVNPEALRDITGLTGGYTEVVRSAADLGPATARIADELNKQYTIGYSSSKPPDGDVAAAPRPGSQGRIFRARPSRLFRPADDPLTGARLPPAFDS